MKTTLILAAAVILSILTACSSTNENQVSTNMNGLVGNVGFDPQTGAKMGVQAAYGTMSFRMVPLAKGQGMEEETIFCNSEGKPLYASRLTVFPVGQEAVLRLTKKPKPWFSFLGVEFGGSDETRVSEISLLATDTQGVGK